ncbi:unnamed protein product [Lactuca virosa]|uniref:Uncharacterized protein n=1 Tax=Lactuca virosa TaxID=75947 RepID=A0AAU9NVT4_9ASTR|nr:unnamed protein product [Lactuca virosa]
MNIVASDNADMNFQMNFIALLINSLIESSSCGKANTYPLNYIMKNTNISNIDWCSYLLNCLVKTKRSFDSSNPTSNFVGPSAFFVMILKRLKKKISRRRTNTKITNEENPKQKHKKRKKGQCNRRNKDNNITKKYESYCSIHRRKANSNRKKKEKEKDQMKKTQQKQDIKKRKKKIIKKHFDTIRNRCTPGALLSVIQGLNEVQKNCVKQMGFGGILNMKMTEVPGALSCFVLKNFNSETKKIVLQKGVIDVTKESVKEILGFPLGRKQFSKLKFRTTEDKCYEEWTNQFDDKKMIRLQDIKMKNVSTNKADMNFKMNFIALLINSLIESSSSGKANTNPLNYIISKTKIENIDWCSYLIDCLVKNKQSFNPSNPTSNFNGPSAYLVLLYLDRIKSDVLNIERTRPVICHWTLEKIKMRETFEKDELGDFGTGDFNDEYVDEELNEESYEHVVMNKYKKLHMMIEDGINKFPENITLYHLKISFDAIFKDKSDNSDDDDDNGDDNDQSKKKNLRDKKMSILKEERNRNEKNKDEGGEAIKIIDGEKDENDNNDKGLDDMNLNDEAVANEKGGNNKEQNVEGEAVEGMHIKRKNDKKVEGITGEQPQRDGEDGEKDENDNNDHS